MGMCEPHSLEESGFKFPGCEKLHKPSLAEAARLRHSSISIQSAPLPAVSQRMGPSWRPHALPCSLPAMTHSTAEHEQETPSFRPALHSGTITAHQQHVQRAGETGFALAGGPSLPGARRWSRRAAKAQRECNYSSGVRMERAERILRDPSPLASLPAPERCCGKGQQRSC